uniref:N-acetyltransferase domain-containing protein n=1 Tax=Lutzomyia longipalpis TaxID=7200 RepID=A0A1B0CL96_LUTLO
MSHKRVFKIINNGEIAIQLYNPQTDIEGVLHVLREGYMKDANTFVAFEMNTPEAAQARQEYEGLIHAVLHDGLSLIARHLPSMEIIAYCLNKIQSRPAPGQRTFYETFRDGCQTQIVKKLLNFRISKDKQYDLHNMFDTDHVFEIVYIATLPQYRIKNIGFHLVHCTMMIAREIVAAGHYPDTAAEEVKGKIPKIIFGSSSSKYSAKIGEKLNFSVVKIFPFKELKVDGRSFSEKVPPQHTHSTINVFKL